MARTGITYEDVAKIIEELMIKGDKPTILSIREGLGGVGSPNTISKYLKEWREKALQSNKQTSELNIPDETIEESEKTIVLEQSDNIQSKVTSATTSLESLDPIVQSLLQSSKKLSSELLNAMSHEWDIILNEKNDDIKIRKLHSALIKEQARREVAEKIAQESKSYSETIKEQVAQRINELKESLESEVAFLNGQIRKLKKESETDIDYYRDQLDKANNKLIEVANNKS